jgi:hypothetical protein
MQIDVPASASLQELLGQIPEPMAPDPGGAFRSSEEWAAIWGVSHTKAGSSIRKLWRAGIMEVSARESVRADGVRYQQPVYRIVPEDEREEPKGD